MLSTLFTFALPLALGLQAAAQTNSSIVVCIAGQCLQGYSNTTLGTRLTVPGSPSDLLLLPGSYAQNTNPELLHTQLTASNAKLEPSPGFENATTVAFPLNVGLQAGVVAYANSLYGGSAGFTGLANSSTGNTSAPTALNAASLAIAPGVWVAVAAGSSNKRVVLWDSLPDVAQLPTSASGALALLDIQGTSCSPSCAGAGVCTASGTCACPSGFNGTACETCSPGFFGPQCQSCPSNCTTCDDGISGSGLCLVPEVQHAPSTCNCLNGQCEADGSCTCNSGWIKADNGTACAKCDTGFFLSSAGNCQVCQLGCDQCSDGTGECIQCKSGFTQNANDNTKCLAPQSSTSSGQICPDGSFGDGASCTPCAAECQTCSGSTSNDCTICANGKYMNTNGTCVSTDSNGVCAGSTLIADNIKHECDSCPSKCTACGIPNFSVASTVNQLTCTACLPGSVLSNRTCTDSCPAGTFLSPTDNMTCEKCDSSCGSCLGSSTFCLTCSGGELASQGKCVSSCPSNTFSSSGTCLLCHPDCATCSGTGFNQCSTCPADRPVLSNGRCLPTCAKAQFFDPTSNTCQSCDSSCSSCSASGPSGCLACSSSSQVLQSGTCVDAKCTSNTTVVAGLGVCLSDLVQVPTASTTSGATPLPSLTGISAPTVVINDGPRRLAWWEILLMALGCAFIFLVVLMCWRRRARKQRLLRTARFAQTKALARPSWRDRFFFWRRRAPAPGPVHLPPGPAPDVSATDGEAIRLMRIRNAEEARHHAEMEKMQLYGAYEYSRASTHAPTLQAQERPRSAAETSMFSEVMGEPARAPQPRQPVRTGDLLGLSRFSFSTYNSGERRAPSPAQAYAAQVRQGRLEPQPTGTSLGSRNPFRP